LKSLLISVNKRHFPKGRQHENGLQLKVGYMFSFSH